METKEKRGWVGTFAESYTVLSWLEQVLLLCV